MSVPALASVPEPEPDRLDRLGDALPGAATFDVLANTDPSAVSEAQRVELVVAAERVLAYVAARQAEAIASLRRPTGVGEPAAAGPADGTAIELSAALRLSEHATRDRLWVARELVDRFPAMLGLLQSGRISYAHARALVEATTVLDDDAAAEVERRLLAKAPDQTVASFRRSLRRAVLRADPTAARKRRDQKVKERRIERWALDDGIAALYMEGPAEDIDAVYDCATELGRQEQRDGSTPGIDALRFDIVKDAVISAFVRERPPTHQGLPVMLHVHGRASTLAGLNDEPGHLDGSGPIPASVLRRLAAQAARWTVVPVDDNGRLLPRPDQHLNRPRAGYVPDATLRRYVITRDRRCTFPGCSQPAVRADLDHANPWPNGPTDSVNLHAACRRHHRAKTTGGWRVIAHPDESRTWISPLGREYHVHPPDQLDY